MMKKGRILMLLTTILLLLVVGIFVFFQDYLPWNKDKAKQMAEKYLQKVYVKKEMEFVDIYVRGPAWESSYQYWVIFRDKENPEIKFHVDIPDITVDRCFDDYLDCFFLYECQKTLQPQIVEILGDNTKIDIFIERSYLSKFFDSPIEDFNVKEIDDETPYRMYIRYKPIAQDITLTKEKMWETVKLIQSSVYTPDKIIFEDESGQMEDITLNEDEWIVTETLDNFGEKVVE